MASKSTVYDCSIIELPKLTTSAGSITPIAANHEIPFDIQRIYYLYDIPAGETRGGHAHKQLHQLIVAASGSFDVVLDDGKIKKTVNLNQPHFGLYVKPGIWRELINFSSGAVLLVLASLVYTENDYVRNYSEFKAFKNQ